MKEDGELDRSVRVVVVLQEIAAASTPITANEIAERTEIPKATVYRLCDQLLGAGLIRRQLGGRGFVPAAGLVDLANAVLAGRATYMVRHAILASVARSIGETCNLVAPQGTSMVYWDRVETEWPLRLQLPIGTQVPFHATASGKMFLASVPESQCRALLDEVELQAYTERTLTSPKKLIGHLQDIRRQGFSLDNEEFIAGMTAVAVPVSDKNTGRYVASLAVHAPTSRMSLDIARGHVDTLRDAADRISACIPEAERADA